MVVQLEVELALALELDSPISTWSASSTKRNVFLIPTRI